MLRNVEDSLQSIAKELDRLTERREILLRQSRDVLSLSSKAVVEIHLSRPRNARELLSKAVTILRELREVAGEDLVRYLTAPEMEVVEAEAIYAITAGKSIPSKSKLAVSSASYLLGLLDAVGEVKRLVVDGIRRGASKEASRLFDLMEALYVNLSSFAIYDNVVPSLRKKLDVDRILLEDTRARVAEELRRAHFLTSMKLQRGGRKG